MMADFCERNSDVNIEHQSASRGTFVPRRLSDKVLCCDARKPTTKGAPLAFRSEESGSKDTDAVEVSSISFSQLGRLT